MNQGHIQSFTQELAVCGAGRSKREQRGQLQVADQGLLNVGIAVVYSRGSWPFMAQESTLTGWEVSMSKQDMFWYLLGVLFGISCIYLIYIYIYIHLCGYIIPHVVTGMMSSRGSYPQIAASFRLNTIYPRYPQLYTPLYTTHPIYFIYPKHSQLYTAHIIS